MKIKETITRKKLYKSGKSWVAAATAFAVMGVSAVTTVSADTQTPVGTTQSQQDLTGQTGQDKPTTKEVIDKKEPVPESTTNNDSKSVHASGKDIDQQNELNKNTQSAVNKNTATENNKKTQDQNTATTPDTKESNKAVSDDQKITVQDDRNIALSKNLVDNKDAISTVITGGRYEQQDGHFVYLDQYGKKVIGLQNINGNVQYFDENGAQVKGDFRPGKEKNKVYFDKNTGNAIAYISNVDGVINGVDATGKQIKDNFLTDEKGNTYYFDSQGNMLKGLQTLDGKQYYFDEEGLLKKNYAATFNNQVIYFDSVTGIGKTALEYQFSQGLTDQKSDFTAHNAANSYDAKSFDNIQGFLTADSWYQPKDILKGGETWVASTEDDKRPLLMTWWPDKQTQANYINYMSKTFATNDGIQYDATTNQSTLNLATQNIQVLIEQRIAQANSIQWLKNEMSNFIKEQFNWSKKSENIDYGGLQFQGGFLKYNNTPLASDTNSAFRLLNRVLFNRDGNSNVKGSEFLLANDVDNSNPVVQAEQLNWLHYLMNFGTITANDPDANFDSIRVDAVDNVDADLLDIARDYFNAVYKVNQSDVNANKHISILEDWSGLDPNEVVKNGNPQLTLNTGVQNSLLNALTKGPNNRWGIDSLIDKSTMRYPDKDGKILIPNYSFVRAHDSEVQGIIGKILTDHTSAESGNKFTKDQLKQALDYYYADQDKTVKEYSHYNMASAYAALLTNKNTIPRVYYGDMYKDNDSYMTSKTNEFDSIDALLKARIKYVSGNQEMGVDTKHQDVLTSVRNGNSRTEGIGVIISNNPNLNLGSDKITLSMGVNHANQMYRPLLLATDNGIDVYNTDSSTTIRETTDGNGNLEFSSNYIKGYGINNSKVSGYLAVWVPVGADDKQDARVATSQNKTTDGSVFHANDALDTNVIYEGFSNFQQTPNLVDKDQRTNVIIAKEAKNGTFSNWGITSFQMPPQYRSSHDGTFVDSTIDNGYAFTDRYDLGFNNDDGTENPTKYGTVEDLRNAIKALHSKSIQAMADWVPDQIYNLSGQQVTSVTRVNEKGETWPNADIENVLYVVDTVGGGKYQAEYGGKYLGELQQKYPDLFTKPQITTGVPMDANTRIKEWSAKYFNGTNILGRGAYYVLKDWASNQYFNVNKADEAFLPLQLMNQDAKTGFVIDAVGVKYYSISGYQAKNSFIQDDNHNWYYFDNNGYMVRPENGKSGLVQMKVTNADGTVRESLDSSNKDGRYYYFMPNGMEIRNGFVKDIDGKSYYFNSVGEMLTNQYVFDASGNAYHLNSDGTMSTGLVLAGYNNVYHYYGLNGVQVKGKVAYDKNTNKWYSFDANSGDSQAFTDRPNNTQDFITIDTSSTLGVNADYTAYITSSVRQDGLFANAPYGVITKDQTGNDIKWEFINKDTKQYEGQQVQVTRQYTDSKGVSWNLITFAGGDLQGQKLWVDSRALTMTPFKTMNQISFISYANRNDGLFLNAPYQVKGYQLAGMSNQYKGQQVTIAGVANVSGKDWSLISFNGTQYWIDSQALNTNFTHDMNQKVFVNTTSNLDGLFLNAPYRQPGYKLAGLAKNYNNQTVTVSQQYFDDQGTVWSEVVLGGQTVWVDNHALAQMQVSDTSQQLYVNSNGRNDGLFLNAPYRGQGSQLIGMTADYNGQHVQVTKQGQDAYGAQWRLITLNNQQVWVDSRALSTTIMQAMNDDMYVNSNQRTDGLWLNAPYTMSGAKWAGDTRLANGRYVHISKAYSNEVGNTYYLTNLNGQSTWIDKRAFTATFDQVVALNATIVARQRPDGMFKTAPYGEAGAQFVDYVTNYNQQTVPVTKQHSDAQGNQWYLATVNGTQYWIDQRSFSPVVTKAVDYQAKIVPRTTRDGVFSGAPYGEVNAKLVNMATAYQNQVVHATGEYTNASGITWSQFALSGQEDKLWIDKRALQA